MIRYGKKDSWPKNITIWREESDYFLSVPFTWHLPEALRIAKNLERAGHFVSVDGPAVRLLPEYMGKYYRDVRYPGVLCRVNPEATRATRGCNRGCKFCGVSRISGKFQECDLRGTQPLPVLVDDNFLMASDKHFNRVIDWLRPVRNIDFTQGLDASLLTSVRADCLLELHMKAFRFAWDEPGDEAAVIGAVQMLLDKGLKNRRRLGVYVLINFGESQDEALYRMQTLKRLGIRGYAMRYQPLDTLKKNSFVAPQWTQEELYRFLQYWNRQRVYGRIPFEEFDRIKWAKKMLSPQQG